MFIKVVRAPLMFDGWVVVAPDGAHLVRPCEEIDLVEGERAAWFLAEPSTSGWRIVQRAPGERRPCAAPRAGSLRRELSERALTPR
jgi:hypothetical protein